MMRMQEIELKFQVPVAARAAVAAALGRGRVERVTLQAHYFDTLQGLLAQQRMALRLRKEGEHWVQTLKGQGANAMERWEDNQAVHPAPPGQVPALDPARHRGTPVGDRLMALLSEAALPRLLEIYRTCIERVRRVVRVEGSRIELAWDVGRIEAGERHHAVCELELELLSGSPRVLIATAYRWVARHGLMLDTRSKAEMGERLWAGPGMGAAATKAQPVSWPRGGTLRQAWQAALRSCLAQILPNASEIACGEGQVEHLHQLRVGLRRLRTAVRLFGAVAVEDMDAALMVRVKALFRQLGGMRDADVLAAQWAPWLEAAGLTPVATMPMAGRDGGTAEACVEEGAAQARGAARGVLADPACTSLWLDLMRALYSADGASTPARDTLRPILHRWWRQLRQQARAFDALDDEAGHDLRKRVKRLRYALSFAGTTVRPKQARRVLALLAPMQTALGAWADLNTARAALCPPAGGLDPQQHFMLGWVMGREPAVLAACQQACQTLVRAQGIGRGWR